MHTARTLVAVSIVAAVLALFAARAAYPALTGLTTVNIIGTSMEPTIPLGSLVYLDPAAPPRIGDVIAYRAGGSTITHRIIGDWTGHGDTWSTKGDNSETVDPYLVTDQRIIGHAIAYLPYVGFLSAVIAAPQTILFLALVAAALLYWPTRKPLV